MIIVVSVIYVRHLCLDGSDLLCKSVCCMLQEMELLDNDAVIFKLVGPVLVKQDSLSLSLLSLSLSLSLSWGF